jgi:hypothetical protein
MNKLQLKRLSAASSLFVLICFLQGCATQKTLIPTGGSRADGTVKLSYEYGLFEKPQINLAQGEIAAKQKCAAWGYTDADAFGGVTTTCNQPTRNGCERWFATIEYQCTGAGRPN